MINLHDGHFTDEFGRRLVLRGVNLSGSSKIPAAPDGATWKREGFYDHRHVSFVGRPFPLAQADEHFQRLRAWGFTLLRFLITWEAIEHAGPGIYDQAYLDYLYQVIRKAAQYDLEVFIDPHQDVWSRFTGGDGAPGWTVELVGMDLARLNAAGAALLHQEHGDPLPRMVWPTNYGKLAAATLFTLFFGGCDFAPRLQVEGVPIQEYLQSHYINAVKQVAGRLKDLPNVVGYETLNEPSAGWIGLGNISALPNSPLLLGETPTVFQSMLLGSGFPQEVGVYRLGLSGFKKRGARWANPHGLSIWRDGFEDVWKQHGVWDVDAGGRPRQLIPDYFSRVGGRRVDFTRDYFKPFANRFACEIRSIVPQAAIFVAGVPNQPELTWGPGDAPNIVHAPHWYDGITLINKSFNRWLTVDPRTRRLILGQKSVRRSFADQVAGLLRRSDERMNHAPTLIGEVGIPFDLQGKRAYRTGDFSMQIRALDATLSALESNFASFTLWNYTPDNTNARGDRWNDEDLSIFSRDQMTGSESIHDGGRALKALVRPYPRKIAGSPVRLSFELETAVFEFEFRPTPGLEAATEILIPGFRYPHGCRIEISDGTFEMDGARQILSYRHTHQQDLHTIRVTPAGR